MLQFCNDCVRQLKSGLFRCREDEERDDCLDAALIHIFAHTTVWKCWCALPLRPDKKDLFCTS